MPPEPGLTNRKIARTMEDIVLLARCSQVKRDAGLIGHLRTAYTELGQLFRHVPGDYTDGAFTPFDELIRIGTFFSKKEVAMLKETLGET